ncbi:unnamed protein product, partial [Didymodactylos carnosus]
GHVGIQTLSKQYPECFELLKEAQVCVMENGFKSSNNTYTQHYLTTDHYTNEIERILINADQKQTRIYNIG